MKYKLFIVTLACSATSLLAADLPAVSRNQSLLRGQYTQAEKTYQQLSLQILPDFVKESGENDDAFRLTEFIEAHKKVSALEKAITAMPTTDGASRTWQPRSRPDSYEPRESGINYFGGPGADIILYSGEFIQNVTDMSYPTRGGLGFAFRRAYSSRTDYSGPIGNGWDFNYNARLILDAATIEAATRGELIVNGTLHKFTKNGGSWGSAAGNFYRLEYENGKINIYDRQLFRMEFEKSSENIHGWRLKALASRHSSFVANRVELTYQKKSDRLERILEPYGNQINVIYDKDGRIIQLVSPTNAVAYSYDSIGNLCNVKSASAALSLSQASHVEIRYGYELVNGKMLLNSRIINNAEAWYSVNYDQTGRVISIGDKSKEIDCTWRFSREDNSLTVIPPSPGVKTIFVFEDNGNNKDLPSKYIIPALQSVDQYVYTGSGLLAEHIDALGIKKVYSYDGDNIRPELRGNLLSATTFPMPKNGEYGKEHICQEITYCSNSAFPSKKQTFELNELGNRKDLSLQEYEYSADWEVSKFNDNGITTRYMSNKFGETVLVMDANNRGTINYYEAAWPRTVNYEFNAASLNGAGLLARSVADAPKKQLDELCSELGSDKFIFNETLRVQPISLNSYYSYDKNGNVVRSKTGSKSSFALYNRQGNTLASCSSGKGMTIVSFTPDFMRSELLRQFCPSTDAGFQGATNSFFAGKYYKETISYDSLKRVSAIQKTDELLAGKAVCYIYSYYPDGRLQSITDPSGITRVDEYSESGLLKKQVIRSGDQLTLLTSDYTYFSNGAVKQFSNVLGETVAHTLDKYGRMVGTTHADGVKNLRVIDGAGRVTEEIASKGSQELTRKIYEYGESGKLSSVSECRIAGDIKEKFEVQRFIYDSAGNMVATKGIRDNSWEYFLHDGLNRQVANANPNGDISLSIYNLDSLGMTQQADFIERGKYRHSGQFIVCDAAGNPSIMIPLDTENEPMLPKRIISKHNAVGQIVATISVDQNRMEKSFNSMGLLESERIIPLSRNHGEEPAVTTYTYGADGKILQKSVGNKALAIRGTTEKSEAAFVEAPQNMTYTYDSLSREKSIQQPDGLIISKKYDSRSMPTEMMWTHATEPQKILRHLALSFNVRGRLSSITDKLTNKQLRNYVYDGYGNCIVSSDFSGDETVVVKRIFDSMGLQLSETISIGDRILPGFSIGYSLRHGKESLKWQNLPALSPANWHTQHISRDFSGRVIGLSLNESRDDFASWKYIGMLPVERNIPESQIYQKNTYDHCGEFVSTDFLENSQHFGSLAYKYDKYGNTIYSSTLLAGGTDGRYTFAQYMGYNSLRQLVEQNGEVNLPDEKSIVSRREQVLVGAQSLQAEKTSRMAFDQTDNIWAQYHGRRIANLSPDSFTKDNLSSFLSPAGIIQHGTGIPQKSMFELASNRETTQATFSPDNTLTAEENIYDTLGNLIEFKGNFWNGEKTVKVTWHLQFDPLGRLGYMKGIADSETSFLKKGEMAAELFFCYDANNRRIKKTVKDYSRFKKVLENTELTVYIGNNQSVVLKEQDGKFTINGQYLWNMDSREVLMAALPQGAAENTDDFNVQRYYFQQDRSLNTICITRAENGKAILVSGVSYLGFGKNATMAKIAGINSSMKEDDSARFAAMNNNLDDTKCASWENPSPRAQYMEIKLSEQANLTMLRIWTDKTFPQEFKVFVLPVGVDSPRLSDELSVWMAQAASKGHYVYQYNSTDIISEKTPISIPLYCMKGDRIILAWDKDKHAEKSIQVREFEVNRTSGNPGAIAFAGQWLDRETDMYYQINRYKLAGANRFISPDPIGFWDGNNLYAYAKNNPLEWHDPHGEWAHIVLGAIAGAAINSGVYAVQCWISGAEFSWAELGIKAGTGALAGGVAAATFGAVNPFLAGWGFNATANIITSAATAGFTSGFASGAADTLLHGGGAVDALKNGFSSGAWGAAAGAIGGGVLSYTGASFGGTVISGAVAGGTTNSARSAWDAYSETGDWSEAGWAAWDGLWKGSVTGAVIAGSSWGIGRVTERIVPLKGYPEHMTDPREKGILIRTKPGEREYGGLPAKPGYQRQHIKPLSLGGRDVPSNIEYMKTELHSTNPALGGGPQNAHPGAYVNSKPMGTIFY